MASSIESDDRVNLAAILSKVTRPIIRRNRESRTVDDVDTDDGSDKLRRAYLALFHQYKMWPDRDIAVLADFHAQVRKVIREIQTDIQSKFVGPRRTKVTFNVIAAGDIVPAKVLNTDVVIVGRDPICKDGVRLKQFEGLLSRIQFVVIVVAPYVFIVDMGSLHGHTIKSSDKFYPTIDASLPTARKPVIMLEMKECQGGGDSMTGSWIIVIKNSIMAVHSIEFMIEVESSVFDRDEHMDQTDQIDRTDQDIVVTENPDGSGSHIVTIGGGSAVFPEWREWMSDYMKTQ